MKKFFLMSLVGLLVGLTAMAQRPTAGKYYRIVSQHPEKTTNGDDAHGFVITENLISNALSASEVGADDQYNQIWKYSGGKFQNANTQRYIGQVIRSSQAYTSETGQAVTIEPKDANFLIRSGNGEYLHADGGNAIVGWHDTNNAGDWWKFEEVTVDEAAVQVAQEAYKKMQEEKASLMGIVNKANVYAPIVEGYFTGKGCTELKAEYAAMTDDAFKAKMTADELPEQIQTMVLGIKNKWAGEFNPDMSARFRVQSYKAYTRCDDAGTNPNSPKWTARASQMSDRNNPTGIWSDGVQLIYVFVESEIPAGTTLKIAGASGSGVIGLFDNQGIELKQGMNIIYSGLNYTTWWVMYTCAADYTKPVSEYPEVKIHIEGGEVLGYVNRHISADEVFNTADEEATNAEYAEVLDNAINLMKSKAKDMTAINFTVMGERGLFEFPLDSYRQIWSKESKYGAKIYKSITFYDNVLKWEWSNMGWQDRVVNGKADNSLENISGGGDAFWPTYINCKAPTMQCPDGKNPYSGNSHTGMPGTWAVESSYNAERADFDVWCCGHESGHNNQSTINLPSCTESSNNFFSNVITTQYGYRLGRGWSFGENFDAYGYGKTVFCQRDISITMRMWYNLWLYYHVAGHNKQFMPTLHKLLREDLMSFGGEGWHNGKFGGANKGNATTSWLKFYEKACQAAGEDLTEYFRMWGFLTPTAEAAGDYIEVIDGKYYAYCGDYSSYYVHCEKADIDAAIARVKANNWRENLEVMFIEDRQILRQRHDPWAQPGDMKRYNWGSEPTAESLQKDYGNVGDVLTFIDGSANTSDYKYILTGNHITLSGTGGAGFIVRDKDGNIAYMANKYEFDIPVDVALNGFTIETINADGSKTAVADKALTATDDDKLEMLQKAIELAGTYTVMGDPTGKKVGLFTPETLADLESFVAEGESAISGKEVDSYLAITKKLNDEVLRLQVEDPTKKIEEGTLYVINSVRDAGRYLATSGRNVVGGTSATDEKASWMFIPANDKNDGTYYLQNRNSKQLMGATQNAKGGVIGVTMVEELPASTCMFKIVAVGNGKFTVRPMDNTNVNIDPSGNIAMWGSADEGSQWTIQEAEKLEPVTDEMFDELLAKSRDLLADVCDVTVDLKPITLQTTDENAAGYISTNEPGEDAHPLSLLVDASAMTYFVSNKQNSTSTAPHHLMIDLGSRVRNVQFELVGNNTSNNNYAKNIYVYGSNNGASWTKVGMINGTKVKIVSSIIRGATSYRYWRLDVVSTSGKTADTALYPWFAMGDLKMYEATETVTRKTAFESIASSYFTKLVKSVDEAEAQQGAFFRTTLSDVVTYEDLLDCYDKLYTRASKIDPSVDIKGIEADKAADSDIYDLSGRKVTKAGKGMYIINGKKVLR